VATLLHSGQTMVLPYRPALVCLFTVIITIPPLVVLLLPFQSYCKTCQQ
mgnify:CR=1